MSIPVKENVKIGDLQHADKQHTTHDMSGPVTTSHENVEWSGRQDSQTCDLVVPNHALYQAKLRPGVTDAFCVLDRNKNGIYYALIKQRGKQIRSFAGNR